MHTLHVYRYQTRYQQHEVYSTPYYSDPDSFLTPIICNHSHVTISPPYVTLHEPNTNEPMVTYYFEPVSAR